MARRALRRVRREAGERGTANGGRRPCLTTRFSRRSGNIEPVEIQEEMERSFLDYAMSVITARALPDARDGLKPVQRRILYGMYEHGLRPDRKHQKSAQAVGEVMGKYHPHAGDAHLRRAGAHGAGLLAPVPAHRRARELRLSRPERPPGRAALHRGRASHALAMELLGEIDEETVDFEATYDGQNQEPTVLPGALPEPAGQRRRRHRRRHGDEHPAAQPRRDHRRGGAT